MTVSNTHRFDRSGIPAPILEDAPHLVDLYWVAWELAWDHVVARDGIPRSPYMDEGFDPETIWIWDTAFMTHFCKYAPGRFPGIESLDNFYAVMYDGAPSTLAIHHPDNPPLFAWSEAEYVRHTGDIDRVRRVLDAGYLQKHFAFFDTVVPGSLFDYSNVPTVIERTPRGYRWDGVASGMDNTPRASQQAEHGTYGDIFWFDAAAQQALTAQCIVELAELVGYHSLAEEFRAHHRELVELVQTYWDDQDQFFYDRRDTEPFDFHKVKTPAAYWPLLAGTATEEQTVALAAALQDPTIFGGPVPWPSVAKNDPAYRPTGHYWRGGVWIPLAYMSARALADAGYEQEVASATRRLLDHMSATYLTYDPPTIWEAYAPVRPEPATGKDDSYIVRPNFCGWSALAPIAMLVEHVLGVRVDATRNQVSWTRPGGVAGIRQLRCGAAVVDLIDNGQGSVHVSSSHAIRLIVDGSPHDIEPGDTVIG